jgi:putative ABC transport system permease protein
MMGVESVNILRLAGGYLLLLIPLGIMMWYRISLVSKTLNAVLRMTVQLLFVGFYLQVVFKANNIYLTLVWLTVMITVADLSILRHCGLRFQMFGLPLAWALLAGTAIPMLYFVGVILTKPTIMEAQYVIPIGGMILGNCLRGNVIGVSGFYRSIRKEEKYFLFSLGAGASLSEAIRPFFVQAFRDSLGPTIATMSTIGLVSLPGMMTGVILAGADPMTAVKYQIAIMIAIFTGTAMTVWLALLLTAKSCFNEYGILDKSVFTD